MYNCILGIVSVISKINLFFLILQHVMNGISEHDTKVGAKEQSSRLKAKRDMPMGRRQSKQRRNSEVKRKRNETKRNSGINKRVIQNYIETEMK